LESADFVPLWQIGQQTVLQRGACGLKNNGAATDRGTLAKVAAAGNLAIASRPH
jgi:hypothetical protein